MTTSDDEKYLRHAIGLARRHMQGGAGGPFGAVIERDGKIIAEGWNEVISANDPTAHAEIVAIRRAAATLDTFSLDGGTIYASCEPCPMCFGAIYWSHLDRLVYAGTAADAKAAGFDDAFIYEELGRKPGERRLRTWVAHDTLAFDGDGRRIRRMARQAGSQAVLTGLSRPLNFDLG